jgi:hypothetical protein
MSPKDLTLLRRGYALGYRAALRKCRGDLHSLAADFDAELDEVRTEMQGMRDEFNRLRAVEEAVAAERDPNAVLN